MDERTEMLKAAVARCFKAREPVTPTNVRKYVPVDFFYDHDAGIQLTDAEVFHEIQATYKPAPKVDEAAPKFNAAGIVLDEVESNENLPPENDEAPASHVASGPGPSPQARLDAARIRERDLLAARPILQGKLANARTALAMAVRAHQEGGPRQTHEALARDFIAASNAERAARVAGEPWAMKPEQRTRNGAAFVDVERAYSQGGDASTFARRMNRTGNRRGAYPKQSFGTVNRDPSRGAVPAPAPVVKQPIPALGK